jgi:tetratricopeptide (TPR) repeat protein
MRSWALLLLFTLWGGRGLLEEAEKAWQSSNYPEAVRLYREALDAYPARSQAVRYNLGITYLALDSAEKAYLFFQLATEGENATVAALASNQNGLILAGRGEIREALLAFRQALVFDPDLEEARFNYELLRKRLRDESEPPPPSQQTPPPPGQQPPSSAKPPPARQEYQRLLQELRLRRQLLNLSSDRGSSASLDTLPLPAARQLLDEMRQRPTQFVQQIRKSPAAPARREDRPDW